MTALEEKAKTLREVVDTFTGTTKWKLDFEDGDCLLEDQDKKDWVQLEDARQFVKGLWQRLNNCQEHRTGLESDIIRLRSLIKSFQPKLTAKAMAGPPSRYQDLVHEFVNSLEKEIE